MCSCAFNLLAVFGPLSVNMGTVRLKAMCMGILAIDGFHLVNVFLTK